MTNWKHTGAAALVTAAGIFGVISASPTALAASAASLWSVDVGTMQPNGIMAMSFFPSVITVDAGDSITFTGAGHTVSFSGSDGKLPAYGSPQAPAGGNIRMMGQLSLLQALLPQNLIRLRSRNRGSTHIIAYCIRA